MGFTQNRKQSPLSHIYTKERINRSKRRTTFIHAVIGTADKETLDVAVQSRLQTSNAVLNLIPPSRLFESVVKDRRLRESGRNP